VFYPGEEGGTALGEVLFGAYSPAGRLPFTVPTSVDQLPPFEDYGMQGRTYRYMQDKPLFPFGFGLSYTTFSYGRIALSKTRVGPTGRIMVTAVVKNTGKRAGDEVVQCYLSDLEASVPVPRHKLVGFARVHLAAGQKQSVHFAVGPEELACHADDGTPTVEPGEFEVAVGGGQPDVGDWGTAPCAIARLTVA
jgi:beta-glucosidase